MTFLKYLKMLTILESHSSGGLLDVKIEELSTLQGEVEASAAGRGGGNPQDQQTHPAQHQGVSRTY